MATIKQCDICGKTGIGVTYAECIHTRTLELTRPVQMCTVSMDLEEFRVESASYELCTRCYDRIRTFVETMMERGESR